MAASCRSGTRGADMSFFTKYLNPSPGVWLWPGKEVKLSSLLQGKPLSQMADRLDALSLQSSCYGACIPWTWGVCQVPGNLVWYGGFKSTAVTTTQGGGGKGGGVKQQSTTYTYTADLIMDLGFGRVTSIPRVWRGKSLYSGGATGSQIVTVTENWTTPGSGNMTHTVAQTANYVAFGGIAFTYQTNDGLTTSGTLRLGTDYSVAGQGNITVVNPLYHGANVAITYQYRNATIVTTALDDLGLTFISGAIAQNPWSGLASYGNQSIGYSGQCQVAATAYDLGTNASVDNHKFELISSWAYHLGSTQPDIDPSLFLHDVMSDTRQGIDFPAELFDVSSSWSDYCVANNLLVSPALLTQMNGFDVVATVAQLTNSQPLWSGGRLKIIPYGDANATANGRTFTANTTPVYDVTDELWKGDAQTAPLSYDIKAPTDRYNHVRVEYLDRSQQYATTIAEARDLTDIVANGLRSMNVIQAHWICTADIARHVAQLVMQRSLFVTTMYKFVLPLNYVFLEPMDLVTLTDSSLGMSLKPVRITEVDENDDGSFTISCEDYPPGICSAALYNTQGLGGYTFDYNVDPGLCDTPLIFETPYADSKTGLGVFVAVRGNQSIPNTNWGGAQVWVSMDGTNYKSAGTSYGGSRYGKLSAAVSSANTTIPVTGLGSSQLSSGSANDAAVLNTLCCILGAQQEYFAYQTATLTGTGNYTLSLLNRGAFHTATQETHSNGDAFVRVDSSVVQSEDLDPSVVGKTIYVKVLPFNIYGQHQYSLADVSATTYTVTGAQYIRGRGQALRVVARGNSDTAGPIAAALYSMNSGLPVSVGSGTEYNFAKVLRAAPYTVTYVGAYNVLASTANATALAAAMNAVGNDYVAVVWTTDEPQTNRLFGNLPAAMYRCGASTSVYGSPQFKFRSAYVLVGIPGCGQGGGAEAYNGDTDSSTNAWCDLSFTVDADGFTVTGSTSTPRTLRDYSYTGDYNAGAGMALISRGNCSASGTTITGTNAGTPAWNGDCYSPLGYTGGAFCSGQPQQTNADIMIALNSDPLTDSNYTSLDYAWYFDSAGNSRCYESAGNVAGPFSYAANDVFSIVYDGVKVAYVQNGTVRRSVAANIAVPLYFDSAFENLGSVASVNFGPMSAVTGIGTNQIVLGAATNIYIATHVSTGTFSVDD